jgi:hypothetical protein
MIDDIIITKEEDIEELCANVALKEVIIGLLEIRH